MSTEALVARVAPLFGSVGSAFYFVPETVGVGKEIGLDGMRWYFIGRGGVLGDVEAAVVASAFGYFHPASVEKLWNSSRDKIAPRVAGHRYHQCAAEFGRAKFANIAGLDAFNAAAEKIVANANPASLALFAGIAAEPRADDAPARAMQLAAVLRELRGSAHLAAVIASGVSPQKAHFIKRPDMYKAFGYDESNPPTITDADRTALDAAEATTDRIVMPAFDSLSSSEGDALAAGIEAMKAALG